MRTTTLSFLHLIASCLFIENNCGVSIVKPSKWLRGWDLWKNNSSESVKKGLHSRTSKNSPRLFIDICCSKYLPANFFGERKVTSIGFTMPMLTTIHQDVFAGQENNIEIINFMHTSMSVTPFHILTYLKKLGYFHVMYWQNLTTIENGFNVMKNPDSVISVCYADSSVSKISENAFYSLVNLKFIKLSGNKLTSVSVEHNFLPKLFSEVNMVEWNLSEIQRLKSLQRRYRFRPASIDLSKNELTELPYKLFKNLPEGMRIKLSNNKIMKTRQEDWKLLIARKLEINLFGNKISCDCSLLPLIEANRNSSTPIYYTISKEQSVCTAPLHVTYLAGISSTDMLLGPC